MLLFFSIFFFVIFFFHSDMSKKSMCSTFFWMPVFRFKVDTCKQGIEAQVKGICCFWCGFLGPGGGGGLLSLSFLELFSLFLCYLPVVNF